MMDEISLVTKKNDNVFQIFLPRILGHLNAIDVGQEIILAIRQESPDLSILFNCSDLSQINNSGLRLFVITMRKLNQTERKLNLCCVKEPVLNFFTEAGVVDEFQLFDSEEDALAALK